MPFDIKKLRNSRWDFRTKSVPVPELADFFDTDEPPVMTARNLDAAEYARVAEEARDLTLADRADLIDAVDGGTDPDILRAFVAHLREQDGKTPAEVTRRLYFCVYGVTQPEGMDVTDWAQIARHYADAFFRVSNAVMELCGEGSVLKKPAVSTASPK